MVAGDMDQLTKSKDRGGWSKPQNRPLKKRRVEGGISLHREVSLFFQAAGWSNLARPLPDPRNPTQLHWNLEILLEPCGE